MSTKSLIKEIQALSLKERFLIIEETLESIKKEELNYSTVSELADVYENYSSNERFKDVFVNEKSLAIDWLSEEDNRWDSLFYEQAAYDTEFLLYR